MPAILKYLFHRLLMVPITFLIVTGSLYAVLMLAPAEERAMLYMPQNFAPSVTEEDIERMIQRIIRTRHLDDPFPIQYASWLGSLVRGDWGYSPITERPVLVVLVARVPVTAELALYSVLTFIPLGVLSGVHAARRSRLPADHAFRAAAFVATSLPPFVLGLLLLAVFYVGLGWFGPMRLGVDSSAFVNSSKYHTVTGMYTIDGLLNRRPDITLDALRHLALPVVTLSLSHWATLGRLTRASVLDQLDRVYVTAARARGLSQNRVVWKHALRNAVVPALNSTALSTASMLTGVFVVEFDLRSARDVGAHHHFADLHAGSVHGCRFRRLQHLARAANHVHSGCGSGHPRSAHPRRHCRRMKPLLRFVLVPQNFVGLLIVLAFLAVALAAPALAPFDDDPLLPPYFSRVGHYIDKVPHPPSAEAPLGTLGGQYSVYYTLIWGTRSALRFGLIVAAVSAAIGVLIGTSSGYAGGWLQRIAIPFTDAFLAVPTIAGYWVVRYALFPFGGYDFLRPWLANPYAVASVAQRVVDRLGLDPLMITLILFSWMPYARITNSITMHLREIEYVQAARALGAGRSRILLRHIIPNGVAPVIVLAARDVGGTVMLAAAFSFIGIGGDLPWGELLAIGRDWIIGPGGSLLAYWWVYGPVTAALLLFGISWNLLGDGLNDLIAGRQA